MGVPPSLSFFSEIFILSGLISLDLLSFLFRGGVLFLGGCYGIFLYVVCFHGAPFFEGHRYLGEAREYFVFFFHFFYLMYCVYFMCFFL